MQTLARITN